MKRTCRFSCFMVTFILVIGFFACGKPRESYEFDIVEPTDGITMDRWDGHVKGTIKGVRHKGVKLSEVEVIVWIYTPGGDYNLQGIAFVEEQNGTWRLSKTNPVELNQNIIVATLHKKGIELGASVEALESLPQLLGYSNRVSVYPGKLPPRSQVSPQIDDEYEFKITNPEQGVAIDDEWKAPYVVEGIVKGVKQKGIQLSEVGIFVWIYLPGDAYYLQGKALVDEGNNTWRLSKTHPSGTIHNDVIATLHKEEELVFSIGLRHRIDLDNEVISDGLRQEFKDNETPLSQNTTILIKDKGSNWVITDKGGGKTYFVKGSEYKLNIYQEVKLEEIKGNLDGLPDLLGMSNPVSVSPRNIIPQSVSPTSVGLESGNVRITEVREDAQLTIEVEVTVVPDNATAVVNFWYGVEKDAWYPQAFATVAELEKQGWRMRLTKRPCDEVVATLNDRPVKPNVVEFVRMSEGSLASQLEGRGFKTVATSQSYPFIYPAERRESR